LIADFLSAMMPRAAPRPPTSGRPGVLEGPEAMFKPYDATTRELVAIGPAEWATYLNFPVPDWSLVTVLDSNLSTHTAEADKALLIGGPRPVIVHLEILAGRDLTLLDRLHWYNTLLRRRHKRPVWTVTVLLRPAADGPELTGRYVEEFPDRGRNLWFKHDVVRVWPQPPERL
jgi:hypothetical protein